MIQIICTNCKVLISYTKNSIKEICTPFTTIFTLYTKKKNVILKYNRSLENINKIIQLQFDKFLCDEAILALQYQKHMPIVKGYTYTVFFFSYMQYYLLHILTHEVYGFKIIGRCNQSIATDYLEYLRVIHMLADLPLPRSILTIVD